MKILLAATCCLLLSTMAIAAPKPKACEGLKFDACIDRADCAWTKSQGKGKAHCRTLKAKPR